MSETALYIGDDIHGIAVPPVDQRFVDAGLADRLVERVDDRLGRRLERVLPIPPAAPALVALGYVRDAEHGEITEMIPHPTRHERLGAHRVTDRRIPWPEIPRADRRFL